MMFVKMPIPHLEKKPIFFKLPFILILVILSVVFLGSNLPLIIKQALYATSLSIKDIIMAILPLIIFGVLFNAIVTLAKKAANLIVVTLLFICASNFVSIFLAHYVAIGIYHFFNLTLISPKNTLILKPLWMLSLPKLISNNTAIFSGVILGMIITNLHANLAIKLAIKMELIIKKLLRIITYLIPLFMAGFIIKLQYEGLINLVVKNYILVFGVIALAQLSYLSLVYWLLANRHIKQFIASIKNMLPAATSGFSTMSSVATMPLTLIGVENNVVNKVVARSVVPITVNIHLVGACFSTPIFAYAILKSFAMPAPSSLTYLVFTLYLLLAKFSMVGIPGGGTAVASAILISALNFNADMVALFIVLATLIDPLDTCTNVLGNGAFAQLIDRWISYFNARK